MRATFFSRHCVRNAVGPRSGLCGRIQFAEIDARPLAVKRAGPYGDMKYLKKPWKFTEVFLFDDNRRFKPRTLDE